MALTDARPYVVNTDGSPLLCTTSYQTLYTPTNGHQVQVYLWANNYSSADADMYWRWTTGGQEIIITVPAKSMLLVCPGDSFIGDGSKVFQVKASASTSIVALARVVREF